MKFSTSSYILPGRMDRSTVSDIVRLDSVDSTNTHLANLIQDGANVGTAVIAREQTKGRGQLGRYWHSPGGVALYMSISWRGASGEGLPAAISYAIAYALRASCGVTAKVRWPNDVIVDGRKAAGVLVERAGTSDTWIIGVGVNINNESFPSDLEPVATSVLIETGCHSDLGEVEDGVICCIDAAIARLESDGLSGILDLWRKMDATPGSLIRVRDGAVERIVHAIGVDDQGRLIARDGNKFTVIIGASGIEWVRTGSRRSPGQ